MFRLFNKKSGSGSQSPAPASPQTGSLADVGPRDAASPHLPSGPPLAQGVAQSQGSPSQQQQQQTQQTQQNMPVQLSRSNSRGSVSNSQNQQMAYNPHNHAAHNIHPMPNISHQHNSHQNYSGMPLSHSPSPAPPSPGQNYMGPVTGTVPMLAQSPPRASSAGGFSLMSGTGREMSTNSNFNYASNQSTSVDSQMNAMLAQSLRNAQMSPRPGTFVVGGNVVPVGVPHPQSPQPPFQNQIQQQQQQQQFRPAPMNMFGRPPNQQLPYPSSQQQFQQQAPYRPPTNMNQLPPQRLNSNNSTINSPPMPQTQDTFLSIPQFYSHFRALLHPHLPPSALHRAPTYHPSQDEIVASTVRYLTSIQMPPRDISISRVQPPASPSGLGVTPQQASGYMVRVSFRGIKVLERSMELRRVENAVRLLQRVWRGILGRRRVTAIRKAKDEEVRRAAQAASNQNGSITSSTMPGDKRMSLDKAERRKSKVTAFKTHLFKVSKAYEAIINNTDAVKDSDAPSQAEVDFMRLMNSDETFRLSLNLRAMHKLEKPVTLEEAQRNYEVQGGVPGRSPSQMYHDYSPRVVEWISAVLAYPNPPTTTDLVTLLRPSDPLCLLACQMFPHVQCKLLNKGPEFTIHKAVFFLELCKTVGVKPGMLFSLSDLFLGGVDDDPTRKCGLTVLRTVCALERRARQRGWEGPNMILKVERASIANNPSVTPAGQEQPDGVNAESSGPSVIPMPQQSIANGGQLQPQHQFLQIPGQENSSASPNVLTIGSLTKRGSKLQSKTSVSRPRSGSIDQSALESMGTSNSSGSGKRRSGVRPPSISSRASEESMSARRNTFQHYVTSLPQNFKNLARDDKISHLLKLTISEARESLHVLYISNGSVHERGDYEDLMAVLYSKEREEVLKFEEHERRVRVALEIREAITRRNECVKTLLPNEERHSTNLSALSEYVENTVNYRLRLYKRRDRGLPTLVQVSPTKKVDIFTPLYPDESSISVLMRIEAENEELILLDRVLKELVSLHSALLEDLKYLLELEDGVNAGVISIGDSLLRFAAEAATPYITYATLAMGAAADPGTTAVIVDIAAAEETEEYVDENGQPAPTFQSRVVDQFVGQSFKESVSTESGEMTARDAKNVELTWYLSQPLKGFWSYQATIDAMVEAGTVKGEVSSVKELSKLLSDDNDIGAEWRHLLREDRKLLVANVKLGSVITALISKLSLSF
ncbi:hypothetical protein BC830DRAFT_1167182 [Chytriomyces sp. MP71]|nr:hypothetical protein BC830DRAFT_1167182 [Chytriomyces sp. MP71]